MFDKQNKVIKLSSRKESHNEVEQSFFSGLDDEQLQPVKSIKGPVLVNAGAGSGKTRVLTYRAAYMLKSGIKPEEILLLTFTNKAAREMMTRIESILGEKPDGLTGGTYHHVGNLTLRKYSKLVGLNNNYNIKDKEDAKTIFKMAIGELEIDVKEKRIPKETLLQEILSLSINKQLSIAEVVQKKFPQFMQVLGEIELIIDKYKQLKIKNNAVDFDDILIYWHRILKENPKVCDYYANQKYKYIMVDEYQDTNKLQSDIVKLLSGKEQNVMVVGDPNQSIYRWRGAEINNMLDFPEEYPNCKVFTVSYNYRSTPEILNFANNSIQNNTKKADLLLKPKQTSKDKPYVINSPNAEVEAQFVAERILTLYDEGVEFKDIGIQYRSHYMVRELEMELTKRGIPYDIRSGMRFFEQRHIKDVLALVSVLYNQQDEISWHRLLQQLEGIGTKTATTIISHLFTKENIFDYLKEEKDFAYIKRGKKAWLTFVEVMNEVSSLSAVDQIIDIFMNKHYKEYIEYTFENFKDRIQDIHSLIEFASKYNTISSFIDEASLLDQFYGETKKGADDDDKDKVTLTTIHKAKGLEWKYVFVIQCSEGRFPSSLSMQDNDELEEERRLFYVASTRAKKELYISYISMLYSFEVRGIVFVQPSLFIQELSNDLYDYYRIEE